MSLFRRSPPAAAAPSERLAEVLAAVRKIELRGDGLLTDVLAGGYRSSFRGGGVEFADVREYVEGDDPRTVDWNVTARVGRPFVKRFVEERERTVMFVFDLGPRLATGLGAWSLRQAAARFAACLGLLAIDNHDRLGLCAGGAAVQRFVPPKKGAGHVLRVLRDVVELPPAAAGDGLEALLAHTAGRLRRRAVVFVFSDFAGLQPLPQLALCARRHDVIAVRLLAPELHAPPAELLALQEPGPGRAFALDGGSAAVRAAWSRRLQTWRLWRDEQFGRAGVDVVDLPLPADDDLDAIRGPLLTLFRRRALRQARR
ncbi:MAG: DUF58 domain-containing protein [Planctomycetes bacterium]|jgi:uncharacterized protein (DUF58 family)|nr:DUF58 domain-containing protein [Planctomycetota bacterium]